MSLVGSQGIDRISKFIDGINKANNTFPIDLCLWFFNLQPSLMHAQKFSVPPLLSLLAGLKGFCYDGSAFGDCSANFMWGACICSATCSLYTLITFFSPSLCWWVWMLTCIRIWAITHDLQNHIWNQIKPIINTNCENYDSPKAIDLEWWNDQSKTWFTWSREQTLLLDKPIGYDIFQPADTEILLEVLVRVYWIYITDINSKPIASGHPLKA